MDRKGEASTFRRFFLLAVPKSFIGELSCNSETFWYRNFLCIEKAASPLCLLFLRIFMVSKIFCVRGGVSPISVKSFWLTELKNLVTESFCVSENFWYRRNLSIGNWYQVFSKLFFLAVPEIFIGETSGFQNFSGIENFWIRMGGITAFRQQFFDSMCWKG